MPGVSFPYAGSWRCHALALRSTSTVFGVTAEGRPVLLECKLWRNPQARREVIAQILDYASVLRAFTYGDLQVRVKDRLGTTGANPIFDLVRKRYPDTEEARFVDGLSRSLKAGDFLLVVAGDGIHTDLDPSQRCLTGQLRGRGLSRYGSGPMKKEGCWSCRAWLFGRRCSGSAC